MTYMRVVTGINPVDCPVFVAQTHVVVEEAGVSNVVEPDIDSLTVRMEVVSCEELVTLLLQRLTKD
jgi:hypothetical protein